ncbi:MAG: hypothetical protein HC860_02490 [Alkalinema sp. RU_4_3]|nr:hypothetical protein [Alkalinema sp. RU_4_3]
MDVPSYQRLTFALLGVCAPQDLIQDRRRTPFNIGQAIELTGFTAEEAIALAEGLPGGEKTLREIVDWTGGQPFLTQRVCRLMREAEGSPGVSSPVQALIESEIISVWESNDKQIHFQTIQNLVMNNELMAGAMLGCYQRILTEAGIPLDGSDEQVALRLTGLVVKKGDRSKFPIEFINKFLMQIGLPSDF